MAKEGEGQEGGNGRKIHGQGPGENPTSVDFSGESMMQQEKQISGKPTED